MTKKKIRNNISKKLVFQADCLNQVQAKVRRFAKISVSGLFRMTTVAPVPLRRPWFKVERVKTFNVGTSLDMISINLSLFRNLLLQCEQNVKFLLVHWIPVTHIWMQNKGDKSNLGRIPRIALWKVTRQKERPALVGTFVIIVGCLVAGTVIGIEPHMVLKNTHF